MIGLVIVSHSKMLAEGVKELALQMGQNKVKIEAAGGLDDDENPIGTDPMKIEQAIRNAYSEDGVLVLMDIGSAIMSADIALDFLEDEMRDKVILCEAPLVEGAIAAAAQAMSGSSLKEVIAEAKNALHAKKVLLQPEEEEVSIDEGKEIVTEGKSVQITVPNKQGLHARPAAKLIEIVNRFDANAMVSVNGKKPVSASSISQVGTLGAKQGDVLDFILSGNESVLLENALIEFQDANFGDNDKLSAETVEKTVNKKSKNGAIQGIAASKGIAIGKAMWFKKELPTIEKVDISDADQEINLLHQSINRVIVDLETIQQKITKELNKDKAEIFEYHKLLLRDQDLLKEVEETVRKEKINVAFVWSSQIEKLKAEYLKMDSAYLQERASDVVEVGNKVLLEMLGEPQQKIVLTEACIIVTDELGPAETVDLDLNLVQGIITRAGGETSHSAILSRSLGIPAIVGIGEEIDQLINGEEIAINGKTGEIWTKNHSTVIVDLRKQKEEEEFKRGELLKIAKTPAVTKNGKTYQILANVSGPKEAKISFENGADGIGLYRTEFLFMNRDKAPSEEEQYEAYKAVCENMKGYPVTIRTLDVGGDKPIPYLNIPSENNPFLGLRGIRYCLQDTELFKTQLRAICRVSAEYDIRVMFPMVGVIEEVYSAKELLSEVQEELKKEGISFSKTMKVGVMIEVPSTIFFIPQLAAELDFLSIGTNDLTQYLLALDRDNNSVAKYHSPFHPAVLEAIREILVRSKEVGIEVSMCGELAGNTKATSLLIGLGLEKFSMNSPAIPFVKEVIRNVDVETNPNDFKLDSSIQTLQELKKSVEES
ncbi:phosphoenolpyruvate--protein phosphotransferase [Ancylomarina sp. 16SWW S1-10-2]|uniref:phosphoenolpyruvate--protein phosphotransferase n=1 Tax=Ancylomarina sp. 16SWW S1-10-2 TaxID=2499681 RepID=UPI0012AD23C3|nr:phosphoenolpyruvate--protein phosphotransferase [Ancylomarina sp. 16SWW S1-10-2]MRT92764.1 phosphoenolpyruvate--protein phosphotransferase [Ancylomarina sp. 16SWW S1-10-2]